jgi:hypothetical protein
MTNIPVYETTIVNGVAEETLVGHKPGPRAPQDVRATVKTVMFRLAASFTVLAMGLSIAAIGALFSAFVPAYIAYSVAAVYDGLWVYALLGEWMSQTHPKARKASQLAGIGFMLVSMAAIILAADQHGMLGAGIIASFVPLGVKAAWWLRLETTTHRLPVAYQIRLEQERDKVHTALALELENRELDKARALTAELRNLRGLGAVTVEQLAEPAPMVAKRAAPEPAAVADATRLDADASDEDTEDELPPLEPPTLASLTKAEAVRIAISKRPEYTPREIAELLGDYDVTVGEAYVRQVRNRDAAATKS